MHVSSQKNYPIGIAIPLKTAERVIEVYLEHIYASCGGTLTFVTIKY